METNASLLIFAIIFTLIARWLYRKIRDRLRYTYPPGPEGWPVFGNRLDFDLSTLHLWSWDHKKKYGEVSHVNFFDQHVVVLNTIDAMREAMVDYKTAFSGRMPTVFSKYILTYGLIHNPYNEKWAKLRKLVHSTITPYAHDVKHIEDVIRSELHELKNVLDKKGSEPFDAQEYVVKSVGNIIYILLVGKRFDYDDQIHLTSSKMFDDTSDIDDFNTIPFAIFPFLRQIPIGPGKALQRVKHMQTKFLQSLGYYVKSTDNEEKKGLLYEMRKHQQTNKWLTEAIIRDVMFDMLLAGISTTSTSLYIIILILLHKQDVQTRVAEEIDDVVGKMREPTLDDQPYMPYTRAVILETFRYSTFLTMGVPHTALKDVTFRGFRLKKNTAVFANRWLLNHDDDIWDQPWCFKPERYLDKNGLLVPPEHASRRNLVVFGLGNRRCVGDVFARNRIFLFVTHLCQKFRIYHDFMETVPSMNPRDFPHKGFVSPRPYEIQLAARA